MQLFFLVLKLVNKNKGQDNEKGSKLQISFLKQRMFCKSQTYAAIVLLGAAAAPL